MNEALRLRPDLSEAHLAAAFHRYGCYRDFERARVPIAIAAQSLSNSPDLLELMAIIDQSQGRWEEAIWLEMVQGNHPTMEEFRITREQLSQKIDADPTNALLLSVGSSVDIALGRKEEAISEAKRAIEMLPISKDICLSCRAPVEHRSRPYTFRTAGSSASSDGSVDD